MNVRCHRHLYVLLRKLPHPQLQLVLALAVKGQSQAGGVSKTNPNINVLEVFTAHVLPEIQVYSSQKWATVDGHRIRGCPVYLYYFSNVDVTIARSNILQCRMFRLCVTLLFPSMGFCFFKHTYMTSRCSRLSLSLAVSCFLCCYVASASASP